MSGFNSELLTILADCEPFLCEKLTAFLRINEETLLQRIAELRQQGIRIDMKERQVRLLPQLQTLDFMTLSRELRPYQVFIKPIIDSTNQYILNNIEKLNKGDLCLAEYQTAGRGRRGRQWLSPFAGQMILSFYWQTDARKPIDGLSLVIGMAIAESLKQAGAQGISLKWPNDVLLNGRKLAGILIEIVNQQNGLLNLVVGIGLNLSIPKQDSQIDQPWAELVETLPDLDRNQLIITIIKNIYHYLEEFEHSGITQAFRDKWREWDHFIGEEVNIITEKQIITGLEQGIDEQGYLLLEVNNKEPWQRFNGGEVSLRKK